MCSWAFEDGRIAECEGSHGEAGAVDGSRPSTGDVEVAVDRRGEGAAEHRSAVGAGRNDVAAAAGWEYVAASRRTRGGTAVDDNSVAGAGVAAAETGHSSDMGYTPALKRWNQNVYGRRKIHAYIAAVVAVGGTQAGTA